MLSSLRAQLALLATMQALMLVNNATLVAVTGLAGFEIADDKSWATLGVTGYVLGGAVFALPAAALMNRFGRRAGYTIGALVSTFGAALAWHAMSVRSLPMLFAATFVTGLYSAMGASLRFAAADVADAHRPGFRARAIALVLTGGIAGGIIGPEVSKWSRGWLPAQFSGTYLTLVGFAIASMLLAQFLRLPAPVHPSANAVPRPLGEILRQPACWVAILVGALGYGVMNLLMVATPLAMAVCSHPYASAALVIEWHIVGMFAPGLVSGNLITRFGVLPVMFAGCVLMLACVGIALTGVELMQFVAALALLGVGWNFMYTGATTLLTTTYKPVEKSKVQGMMDFCVFSMMVTSSASSGALLHANGWELLNTMSLPFVLIGAAAVVWLGTRIGWSVGRVPAHGARA